MAYPFKGKFDHGTVGTNLTIGNSGGPETDAFTHIILGTGATIDFATLPWGGVGIRVVNGSTSSYVRWDDTSVTSGETRRVARLPIWLSTELTGTVNLVTVYNDSDQAMGSLVIAGPGGNLRKVLAMSPSYAAVPGSYSTNQLSLNTLYWVEFVVGAGLTNTGTLGWRLLEADGVTEIQSFVNNAVTTRAENPARIRFATTTSSSIGTLYFDNLRFEAASSGWLGPLALASPTISVVDQLVALIDATNSSVPSGTLSYSISQTSGATVTPTEIIPGMWSVAPDSDEELEYLVTVTGSLGGVDTQTVTVAPVNAPGVSSPVLRFVKIAGEWV